jgi:hypothetical protein
LVLLIWLIKRIHSFPPTETKAPPFSKASRLVQSCQVKDSNTSRFISYNRSGPLPLLCEPMPAYPLQPDSLPQPLAFQPDSTDFFSNAYLPSFTTRLPINSHQLQDGSLSSDSIEGREVDQSAKSNKQMYILRCRSGERKEERVVIFC